AATGALCFTETFPARSERGGGLPDIDRLPYFPEPARAVLAGRHVVLAGALAPVTYFGYEGIPGELARPEDILTLAEPGDAADEALEALAERIGIPREAGGVALERWPVGLGAAIACPARRVFALQSDGSAQYTIQALWTMARERLPIVVLIASNRR
ncbi:thiamine pyrophosphate-dependent enzyme, partial [Burkholderia gladioli]|uniref:thiamine pyrophosphate-dependent enzyme n=1 Tax=Burkholderia gladioli TaxID=28095 RepID=UPI001FC83C02